MEANRMSPKTLHVNNIKNKAFQKKKICLDTKLRELHLYLRCKR